MFTVDFQKLQTFWWGVYLQLQLFQIWDPYHIRTSRLICRVNQWIGFYMIGTSVVKKLHLFLFLLVNWKGKFMSLLKNYNALNTLTTNLPRVQRPINWFALKINQLIGVYMKAILDVKGLTHYFIIFFSIWVFFHSFIHYLFIYSHKKNITRSTSITT